jgi:ceramide glucosyltransferase
VVLNMVFGSLAALSFLLLLWQWQVAIRFPLHRRIQDSAFCPGVTLFKPLKGCDQTTEDCLRSWLGQRYAGPFQILFAVASEQDPVCEIVRKLIQEFPERDAQLVVCEPLLGANAKVSKLAQLERIAKYEILLSSDADVRAPADFLINAVAPLQDSGVGLVNCFYNLANPTTLAMRWEAIAIDADFWSQVLQAQSLKPMDFALGAVIATRRKQLEEIGGFAALANCLADDYQLGKRIAAKGYRLVLSTVPVECWSEPMGWRQVWKHQLRWARTIRVSQPWPYFFSILSNATLWPLVWLAVRPSALSLLALVVFGTARVMMAKELQERLRKEKELFWYSGLIPVKDLLQVMIWMASFMGNRIEWRGQKMKLRRDGTLAEISRNDSVGKNARPHPFPSPPGRGEPPAASS